MTKDEALAVSAVFADDLARGWIPKEADIAAVLAEVRRATAADADEPATDHQVSAPPTEPPGP